MLLIFRRGATAVDRTTNHTNRPVVGDLRIAGPTQAHPKLLIPLRPYQLCANGVPTSNARGRGEVLVLAPLFGEEIGPECLDATVAKLFLYRSVSTPLRMHGRRLRGQRLHTAQSLR